MFRLIQRTNWFVGGLIFFMPILLVVTLGSQMAYSQVRGRFDAYQDIPEITTLANLTNLPAEQVVMLRGTLVSADTDVQPGGLLIYQERPAEDRDARYKEEFHLIFPEITIALSDGQIAVQPSETRERVIQYEHHDVPAGDWHYTGFQAGDEILVQGQWQPGAQPALIDVTGVSGIDKASLMTIWADSFEKVAWFRNIFGSITLLSIILLVIEIRRNRREKQDDNVIVPISQTVAGEA